MTVYQLPDGRLVVPARAGTGNDGVIGDSMLPITPQSPLYNQYLAWFERTGESPIPIESWPITPAGNTNQPTE